MFSRILPTSLILGFLFSTPAQAEIHLSTQSTTLTQPPTPTQIQPDSPPELTLAQPLSVLGEQVLEAICEGDLKVQQGLNLMPDLSQAHIDQSCPQQLQLQTAQR